MEAHIARLKAQHEEEIQVLVDEAEAEAAGLRERVSQLEQQQLQTNGYTETPIDPNQVYSSTVLFSIPPVTDASILFFFVSCFSSVLIMCIKKMVFA